MNNSTKKFVSFLKKWYVFLVLIAIYVPLILIIIISFNGETSRGNIRLNFDVPTFVNYINLFQNDQFINALLNSLLLGVIVTPFSLLFGVLTCYGIAKVLVSEEITCLITLGSCVIISPVSVFDIDFTIVGWIR